MSKETFHLMGLPSSSELPLGRSIPLNFDSHDPWVKANMEVSFIIIMRLRRLSCVLRKMLMSLRVMRRLSCSLLVKIWKQKMIKELTSMRKNSIWELVDLSLGCNIIRKVPKVHTNKWSNWDVYDSNCDKRKYPKWGYKLWRNLLTDSEVCPNSLILVIVEHLNLELYQVDVKTTFPSGKLDEELYMDQPTCFVVNW